MRKFEPITVALKDGRTVMLREPKQSDASAMLEYMNAMCVETDQLGRSAGDSPITLEQELTWIRNCHTERHFMLIGEVAGRIIASGGAGLTQGKSSRGIGHISTSRVSESRIRRGDCASHD